MQTTDEKHVSSELFTHRKTFANIGLMVVVSNTALFSTPNRNI